MATSDNLMVRPIISDADRVLVEHLDRVELIRNLPNQNKARLATVTKTGDGPFVPKRQRLIDADSATRKTFPIARGLLDYFPDACAAIAQHSYEGNEKHNPGQPMHHARGKSNDHADCILRHLTNRGGFDGDARESTALAWRAMALLQEELEAAYNLPLPRGAKA